MFSPEKITVVDSPGLSPSSSREEATIRKKSRDFVVERRRRRQRHESLRLPSRSSEMIDDESVRRVVAEVD